MRRDIEPPASIDVHLAFCSARPRATHWKIRLYTKGEATWVFGRWRFAGVQVLGPDGVSSDGMA